jgi:hypothetical protein
MNKLIIIAIIVLTAATAAVAGPPTFTPADPDGTPVGVPVDGGASFLLAAGGSYAVKKLKERKRRSKLNKLID